MVERYLTQLWARLRPAVMGVVNVTPDSFSDGGEFSSFEAAVGHGVRLIDEGADIVDIGGESSRPGAEPVPDDVERARVVPVIAALVDRRPGVPVSIDTSKASVAAAALDAGAVIVNDVTAGRDPEMFPVVARAGAGIVLMHMRGEPRTMQDDTGYDDVVAEVHAFLRRRAREASKAGIGGARILVDPGIGFGKDLDGNLRLLAAIADLGSLGFPVVIGASRKRFIGALTAAEVRDRVPGSLAAVAGATTTERVIVRVHDVAETVQFLTVLAAVRGAA